MSNLLYYIFYGINYAISLLPYRVLYMLSDAIYPIVFYVVRYRRTIAEKNLRNSFPEKTPAELLKIERKFYHFFCDYFFETIKLISVSKEELKKRMVMDDLDALNASLDKDQILFVYLGHYCNWEYNASLQWWVDSDIQCSQLYSPLRSRAFDRLFLKIRGRFGGLNISKNKSLRTLIRMKNKGQKAIVGFISDQEPKWMNIHLFMPFLNQDTPVFTGTERIAKKLKVGVFFSHVTRPKRGYYHAHYVKLTDDVRTFGEYEITRLYMQDLEKQIKENPHLWLWTHNRWKRQRTNWDAPEEWKTTLKEGRDSLRHVQ